MIAKAVVLPAADGFCCIEGILFPVFDSGLLV
jgi:hypothetical protein